MKPGWKTSECWIAAAWLLLTSFGVLALAFTSWHTALCLAPSVCALIWMAGCLCNNYGENRYLLKSEQPPDGSGKRQSMGFRSMAVQQAEAESEDNEDEE